MIPPTAYKEQGRVNFTTITESPYTGATGHQLCVLYGRYKWAADQAAQKDVLEVACGAGVGLGLLAARVRSVTGGDIDQINCKIAGETYAGDPRISVQRFDAEDLPFRDRSFDVVILFEALYYLPRPGRFFSEARRVLRPGGQLLISTVNCEWPGFNPSPFSTKYFAARELSEALTSFGFTVRLLAGFPEDTSGLVRRCVSLIRRAAVRLHLIPKTMKGKEWLKRIFYGKLTPIPRRLTEGMLEPEPLVEITESTELRRFRFLYAIATAPGGGEEKQ